MKVVLTILLLLAPAWLKASSIRDTVEFWQISYGKKVVLESNVAKPNLSKREVKIKQGSSDDITVSFVYNKGQSANSTLSIREGKEVLREIASDAVMTGYFKVSLQELISLHQKDVRIELDFFYSDDRGKKDLKLGTLIFIIQ